MVKGSKANLGRPDPLSSQYARCSWAQEKSPAKALLGHLNNCMNACITLFIHRQTLNLFIIEYNSKQYGSILVATCLLPQTFEPAQLNTVRTESAQDRNAVFFLPISLSLSPGRDNGISCR